MSDFRKRQPRRTCPGCGKRWIQSGSTMCRTCDPAFADAARTREMHRLAERRKEREAVRPIIIAREKRYRVINGVEYEVIWP